MLLAYSLLGDLSCSEHYCAGALAVNRHTETGRAPEKLLTSEGSQTSALCRSSGTLRLMHEGGLAVAYSILDRAQALLRADE